MQCKSPVLCVILSGEYMRTGLGALSARKIMSELLRRLESVVSNPRVMNLRDTFRHPLRWPACYTVMTHQQKQIDTSRTIFTHCPLLQADQTDHRKFITVMLTIGNKCASILFWQFKPCVYSYHLPMVDNNLFSGTQSSWKNVTSTTDIMSLMPVFWFRKLKNICDILSLYAILSNNILLTSHRQSARNFTLRLGI